MQINRIPIAEYDLFYQFYTLNPIYSNMKIKHLIFYLITVGLFSFFSCEETEESPLVIFLNPQKAIIETNTNEHILITVDINSTQAEINNFQITQQDDYAGVYRIVDTTINQFSMNYVLDFIVPEYPDSTETLLTFSATDNLGNQIQAAKKILINKGSSLVSESSGHTIYSFLSKKPNAFNLENNIRGFSVDMFDIDVDFMDYSLDSIHGNSLSREWISRNGLRFVQYNGFNFAMANSTMIESAYASGIKLSKATNIQDSDIFLIGREDDAIGVIQVISVVDSDSTLNDKYVFNLKTID